MSFAEFLSAHHTECDELFASAEAACLESNWANGKELLSAFAKMLESHFDAEESVLFPAFEQATGMTSGPTAVMRGEHRQMRELLAGMVSAAASSDASAFSGTAETLLILMQQHNMKEENILYPMCDRALDYPALADEIQHRLGVPCHA